MLCGLSLLPCSEMNVEFKEMLQQTQGECKCKNMHNNFKI